ncbi:hypothetical protein EC957_006647 [Mortierella hygrophila]|uniref:Late embryogenesis abundant protein LEA-2 subgroup domain-containing protein n=1 Tax=Mortierella hygrophila TaxID=979708 RepID=A0A9P6K5U9_9FUNG|nr:hypothetical protein EC957_006647 [Mortierella hygrophila]
MEHDSFLAAHNKEYLAHAQAQAQAQQAAHHPQSYNPSYDPYSNNPIDPAHNLNNPHQYQSPTLSAAHPGGPGSDVGYSSPHLQYNQPAGYQSYQNSPHMEPMEYRQDPYRSAYAQQQHQLQQQQHMGSFSPYQGSMVVPPFEDMSQGTHHSRLSLTSSSVSGASQRYPMHVLQGHGSTQALTAFSQQQNRHHAGSVGPGSSASEYGGHSEADIAERTRRQSSAAANSKGDSGIGQRAKSDEDEQDENTEILARSSQSGDRTGAAAISRSSSQKKADKKSKKKHQKGLSEESDEEPQERGENRYRDGKRCFCCSRRLCVYMTFLSLICLAVALFFLIPRAPGFSFLSVSSMGEPVITKYQFQENFGLQLRVDSSDNYLPLKINSIEMTVWLMVDQNKIGQNDGLPSSYTIKPKTIQTISIPMVFDYTSLMVDTNADGTYQNLIKACGTSVNPTDISLTFGGKINFWGLSWIWKPQFGLNVGNIYCPVNAKDPSTIPPVVTQPPASTSGPAPTGNSTVSGTPSVGGGTTSTGVSRTAATATGVTTPTPSGSGA